MSKNVKFFQNRCRAIKTPSLKSLFWLVRHWNCNKKRWIDAKNVRVKTRKQYKSTFIDNQTFGFHGGRCRKNERKDTNFKWVWVKSPTFCRIEGKFYSLFWQNLKISKNFFKNFSEKMKKFCAIFTLSRHSPSPWPQ